MYLKKKKSQVKGTGKKGTKSKITGKPRRALNAYNYFFGDQRQKILKERESMPETERLSGAQMFAAMGKEVADRWKNLSDESKKKYEDMAHDDKARYDAEMVQYNARVALTQQLTPEPATSTLRDHLVDGTHGTTRSNSKVQMPASKVQNVRTANELLTIAQSLASVLPPRQQLVQVPAPAPQNVCNTSDLLTIAQSLTSVLPPKQQLPPSDSFQGGATGTLIANILEAERSLELRRRLEIAVKSNQLIQQARQQEMDENLRLIELRRLVHNATPDQKMQLLRLALQSR